MPLLLARSVGGAYGVVAAVFQEGVGASLLGVPIVSFIPVMLFAILFGLSMDYNVFVLAGPRGLQRGRPAARERDPRHGADRQGHPLRRPDHGCVFLAFVSQPDVTAKTMGLGLGLAILIDVVLVRLIIAPAVVTLLGDRAWWVPGWLDRVLPDVSLEGHLVQGPDSRETREAERVAA